MKQLFTIICISLAFSLSAKDTQASKGTSSFYKVNFVEDPYFGLEYKLGTKGALDITAGFNINVFYRTLIPELRIGYRYYHSILRRERMNKRTKFNCADFFLADICFASKPLIPEHLYFIPKEISKPYMQDPFGLSWTLQYGTRTFFNPLLYLELRLGVQQRWFYTSEQPPSPEEITCKLDIAFGIIIPFKSKKP
ncbi:hypothetical protein K5X82_11105 [Halosquirtibacter xylanolyticus]|uniref:hypothetical protein n=1 Tax=Halosquirtibacter xylanolyticus TaxID=3374599 RepID=UPI00374955E1|nr:hypothetical protein K5X82_11105 [Prolixibacteraceae bacterium]